MCVVFSLKKLGIGTLCDGYLTMSKSREANIMS